MLSWEYLRPLVQQLCAALDYAHGEDVIHRDLKPANVMVDGKGRSKLSDFGIAATASDSLSRVSQHHSTSGTLLYMSPQQLAGKRPRVTDDLYALGATLYELLTSKPPFHSGDVTYQVLQTPPEPLEERLAALGLVNPVPGDVAALIMACLAKVPEQRPQSARAVAEWVGIELNPAEFYQGASLFQPEASPAEDALPDRDDGPSTSEERSCPACGQTMAQDAIFCASCGRCGLPAWRRLLIYCGNVLVMSVLFGALFILVGGILPGALTRKLPSAAFAWTLAGIGLLSGGLFGCYNSRRYIQFLEMREAILRPRGTAAARVPHRGGWKRSPGSQLAPRRLAMQHLQLPARAGASCWRVLPQRRLCWLRSAAGI